MDRASVTGKKVKKVEDEEDQYVLVQRLRAMVANLIGTTDADVIEHDSANGPQCFWCGRRADIWGRIEHDDDCPVVQARALVD